MSLSPRHSCQRSTLETGARQSTHSQFASYARNIAARLGLGDDDQSLAHVCGLVHDVGKIGLPPGLIEKSGVLTREERRQMEQHALMGERIHTNGGDHGEIATVVRHHHERFDRLGYPDGLAGEEIPLLARVVAVANAYQEKTSDRPDEPARSSLEARAEIVGGSGTQFDPAVVDAFLAASSASDSDPSSRPWRGVPSRAGGSLRTLAHFFELMRRAPKSFRTVRTVVHTWAEDRHQGQAPARTTRLVTTQKPPLERANNPLQRWETAAMEALSVALDARDSYTAGHSRRVQQLSLAIGRELGLSQAELDPLGHAARFHDIGKLAIPGAILLKPESALTEDERALMQRYVDEGERIIDRLGFLNAAVPAIRHQNERFDGTGYPDRLSRCRASTIGRRRAPDDVHS